MDKYLNQMFKDIEFTESQNKMYISLLKERKKTIEILGLISKEKLNKELIIKKFKYTKFVVDQALSFLSGASLIYYQSSYEEKGKFYSLTPRGEVLHRLLEEEKN